MNEIIENMRTRRSVRKYQSTPVPQELVEAVAKAGTYAATGMNLQSPIILAVTKKETRDEISAINAAVLERPDTDPFYGAPVVLVVLAKKSVRTHLYDGSIVMDNMMLAAHSLGLGSCWIHRAKEEFESREGRSILAGLGIEDDYEGIGQCILGYPAEEPAPKTQKENYIYYIK